MWQQLHRLARRIGNEASALMGMKESLPFEVVFVTEQLPGYTGCVIESYLMGRLIAAFRRGRHLRMILLHDRTKASFHTFVLTIDLDRGRVDRNLSSRALLRNPWDMEFPRADDADEHPNAIDIAYAFAALAFSPIQTQYRKFFLARQKTFEADYGYSRRFASLESCLSKQLDHETQSSVRSALYELWCHEQRMTCTVSYEYAQKLLRACDVYVRDDKDPYWEMYDSGPLTSLWMWIDKRGEDCARAYVYSRVNDPSNVDVRVGVYGSIFTGEQAQILCACYAQKISLSDHPELDPFSPVTQTA